MLTNHQKEAVKYYEGEVDLNDPFLSDKKAYVTINSLFFDGISTECNRAKEGKKLNPILIRNTERLVSLLNDLLSSFHKREESMMTYRVERASDFKMMLENKATLSFTSTSTNGFLKEYADRIGIVLLEFEIDKTVPCLLFEEELGEEYLKKEEHECLLPPDLMLEFTELPLSSEEKQIKDALGKEPEAKYRVQITGVKRHEVKSAVLNDSSDIEAICRLYEALNKQEAVDLKDESIYKRWKHQLRESLNNLQ